MFRKYNLIIMLFSLISFMLIGFTTPVFAEDYQFKWRLSQTKPEDSDHHRRTLAFAEEVRVKTDGRIDIKIYSSNTEVFKIFLKSWEHMSANTLGCKLAVA